MKAMHVVAHLRMHPVTMRFRRYRSGRDPSSSGCRENDNGSDCRHNACVRGSALSRRLYLFQRPAGADNDDGNDPRHRTDTRRLPA